MRELKNRVLQLANLLPKYPTGPIIRGNFITIKKLYKSTVRNKNKSAKNKLLSFIADSQERDPQMFWKLINKLRGSSKDEDNNISIDTWFSHFKNVHNNTVSNNIDLQFESKITERLKLALKSNKQCDIMDSPFEIREMYDGINNLVTKKISRSRYD